MARSPACAGNSARRSGRSGCSAGRRADSVSRTAALENAGEGRRSLSRGGHSPESGVRLTRPASPRLQIPAASAADASTLDDEGMIRTPPACRWRAGPACFYRCAKRPRPAAAASPSRAFGLGEALSCRLNGPHDCVCRAANRDTEKRRFGLPPGGLRGPPSTSQRASRMASMPTGAFSPSGARSALPRNHFALWRIWLCAATTFHRSGVRPSASIVFSISRNPPSAPLKIIIPVQH